MNTSNNIFTNNTFENSYKVQKSRYNRDYLMDQKTAEEFNTYLNFGVFPVYADTQPEAYVYNGSKWVRTDESQKAGTPGVRSLFNRAGAVLLGSDNGNFNIDLYNPNSAHYWRINNNVPLLDSPQIRQRIRKSAGCSIKELVEASSQGLMGQETYAYSDFMFCKHIGKVSNNYMITLRRFPLPVDDFIGAIGEDPAQRLLNVSKNATCIGCMVTWMGVSGNNLSDILKYSYKMPFKSEDADRQSLQGSADENQNFLNNIYSVFDQKYREQYQNGMAGEAANGAFGYLGIDLGNPPYKNIAQQEDSLKVYGPVDTIRSTYVRDDKGLEFNQQITLTFEYELRSYNGINGKQAMLDLISNILNVTYTTGSFWGGGYKGYASHQSNIFANLNIFKARGGFTDFIDDFSTDINNLSSGLRSQYGDGNGGIKWSNVLQTLNSIGGMIMSGMLNKLGRPQKVMYNSLLSPAPIGFWHVTIGNPKRPIMSIGNMIITECSIEHQGPLGLDDFPTGLKVTVTLDRGKPRDLRDIEKLYMQGNDRIYTSMGEKVFDMYKNAELYQAARKSRSLNTYAPVTGLATINTEATNPTIKVTDYSNIQNKMKKYFGTTDVYSIYVAAAEQEYGSGKKKPSTDANGQAKGGDGNTAVTGGYYGNN